MIENKISEFIRTNEKCHFMQLPQWAAVKDNWLNEQIIIWDDNKLIKGYISVLIRKVPHFNKNIAYVPRGPIFAMDDIDTFNLLIEKAKIAALKQNCYVLRIDPDIPKSNLDFYKILQDKDFIIKNNEVGFQYTQPRFVMRINIKDKMYNDVFKTFDKKARKNVRSAEKKGVKIVVAGKEHLADFSKILIETEQRNNIKLRNLDYFYKMFNSFAPENIRLYLAYFENELIAGAIPILFGNKCWCLYSATSDKYRNLKGAFLLRSEMIKWAIESKCEIFDLMGVSGDITKDNGLYAFKKSFGSELTEFIGECDLVLSKAHYLVIENCFKFYKFLKK